MCGNIKSVGISSLVFLVLAGIGSLSANSSHQEVTLENIDKIFSYEAFNENTIKTKAEQILKSGRLGFDHEDYSNCKEGRYVNPIKNRIKDTWRYVATKINYFKQAHTFEVSPGGSFLTIFEKWEIRPLAEHFAGDVSYDSYDRRHKSRDYHIGAQEEADKLFKGAKEYFELPPNVKYLRELQLEGLALNLIYHSIQFGTIGALYNLTLKVPQNIIATHDKWLKDPIHANITQIAEY